MASVALKKVATADNAIEAKPLNFVIKDKFNHILSFHYNAYVSYMINCHK